MVKFYQEKSKNSSKASNLGRVVTLDIKRLDTNGCGVGSLNNKPVFVPGTLTGEKVSVKIFEQKSKYSVGKLIDILTADSQRANVTCNHFLSCGGCDLQHMPISMQLSFKQDIVSKFFARNLQIQQLPWQQALGGRSWHYRRKARIGVQYNKLAQPMIGFRQKSSNRLTPIKQCPVLPIESSLIFEKFNEVLTNFKTKSAIGHIEVLFDMADQTIITLRVLRKLSAQDIQLLCSLSKDNNWCILLQDNQNLRAINTAGIKNEDKINNLPELFYLIDKNIKISCSASDFVQVNSEVNQMMVDTAIDWLAPTEQDSLLDLFCGLGNFSLPIARRAKSVVGVEGVQQMVDKANSNARNNNLSNANFYQANLNSDWSNDSNTNESDSNKKWTNKKYTMALLDPARAGAEVAVEQLAKFNLEKILYISCSVDSLVNDSAVLFKQGYHIEKIGLVDMFVQTKHVETMVLFKKS